MTLKATLESLTRIGWPVLRRTHRADSCIAATALALAVLRQRGFIDAYPLTVRVTLTNAAAAAIIDAHPDGITSPAQIAHWHAQRAKLVIIGHGDAHMGRINVETGRFVGHLVAIVPACGEAPRGLLLDLSIGQAARPEYHLHVGPLSTATTPAFLNGERELIMQRGEGSRIAYEAFPSITSYATAPDWQQPERIAPALAATLVAIS